MVKIILSGHGSVTNKLRAQTLQGRKRISGKVSYNTPYAAKIHEDTTLNHPNGGQAKYLEQPARTLRPAMKAEIARHLGRWKKSLESGILAAMYLLYHASRELVPVNTGALRDSARIELE